MNLGNQKTPWRNRTDLLPPLRSSCPGLWLRVVTGLQPQTPPHRRLPVGALATGVSAADWEQCRDASRNAIFLPSPPSSPSPGSLTSPVDGVAPLGGGLRRSPFSLVTGSTSRSEGTSILHPPGGCDFKKYLLLPDRVSPRLGGAS